MINSSTPGALQKASSGSAMATKPGAVASGTGRATGSGVAAGGSASVGMAGKEAPKAKPEVDGDSGCLGCLAVFGGITAFFYTLCARHEAAHVSSSLASIFFFFISQKKPPLFGLSCPNTSTFHVHQKLNSCCVTLTSSHYLHAWG